MHIQEVQSAEKNSKVKKKKGEIKDPSCSINGKDTESRNSINEYGERLNTNPIHKGSS